MLDRVLAADDIGYLNRLSEQLEKLKNELQFILDTWQVRDPSDLRLLADRAIDSARMAENLQREINGIQPTVDRLREQYEDNLDFGF